MKPGEGLIRHVRSLSPPSRLLASTPSGPPVRYWHDRRTADTYRGELAARARIADRVLVGPGIQTYADLILALPWPEYPAWPVRVVITSTDRGAFYRSGEILVPSPVHELVILHELAHHFVPLDAVRDGTAHSRAFLVAMLALIDRIVGPEVGDVFRETLTANGEPR